MYQIRNNLKSAKGLVVVKNIVGLIFIWALILLVFTEMDYYWKSRELEERSRHWIIDGRTLEEVARDNDEKCSVSTSVVKLASCPNLETMDADNTEILSYMTESTAKETANFLHWRSNALRKLKETKRIDNYYLLENIQTRVLNPEIIEHYNLPKSFNKFMLKGSYHVLVKATLKGFNKQDGKQVISKPICQLVNLVCRKRTIEKPYFYSVDSIFVLDIGEKPYFYLLDTLE